MHSLTQAICEITVVVKKVAQNPALLARYGIDGVMKHSHKTTIYYIVIL